MVLLLFFCSGATALVYEVIWSKYLTLLFGSTVQAQTVVLAVFMGGLALGNRIFGGRADRSTRPLTLYGYLEVAIGLYSFFFSLIYKGADGIFASAGSKLLDHSGGLLLLKGLLSAALLLGPTILMGGTLPVLAAWLQQRTQDAGRRSARFYSINSLGAVCGAGLAGFFLVTWLGLPVTLQMTALVNVLIGFAAIGIAKMQAARTVQSQKTETAPSATLAQSVSASATVRWGCVLVTLTGAVSMGLEVLASRCLSLIFGASLQAFAIVLMAFILGIGLGSAAIASPRRKDWPRETTTIVLVLGAAAWIGLLVFNIENLMEAYRYVRSGLAASTAGYRFYLVSAGVFSILILGLPAAMLGSVLPLWIRAVSESSDLLGDRVGRLLTWNTMGAVGGVLLTGFVLMPNIGLRGSFTTMALVLSGAALLIAWMRHKRAAAIAALVVSGLLAVVSATGGEGWRLVLSSGAFRWRETELTPMSVREIRQHDRLVFYEDAADATVSVEENGPANARELMLRVNGKTDASTRGDLSAQFLVAHLPMMMKPEAKDVFVFGMGSGITAGAVLGYPIERLTVAENCEPVLRAAKYFDPWNNGVRTNARTRVISEDARTVLKLSPQQYDVIVAEPSNPWTVGVGSVFSREFYQISANRLKPGGVMAQWFHLYDMNDTIVELVVRTFGTVFPVMEIWEVNGGDIIMLGSDRPWKSDLQVYARPFELEGPRRNLATIGIKTPEMLMARQFASQRTGHAVSAPGPIQTDDFPVLEYQAPKAMYIGRAAWRLFRYDERTWQSDFAALEKNSVLGNLGSADLMRIFHYYRSANPDLQAFVERYDEKPDTKFEPMGGGLSLPCVFGATNIVGLRSPPAAAKDDIVRKLYEAEVMLRSDPTKHAQALDQILNVLETTQAYQEANAGWSVTYYASLAAKLGLRQNNPQYSRRVLLRGLQLEPNSEVLQYLARVFVRDGVLQPAETQVTGNQTSPLPVQAREPKP